MQTFSQAVEGWHDFYIMVGTAAATLKGLLFVSLSLNADVVLQKENADLRVLAAQTFTNFICVLMFAMLFLIPLQGPHGLGIPLFGIGMVGLYTSIRRFLDIRKYRARAWGPSGLAWHFVFPIACFLASLLVAISVLTGSTSGLYWLISVMIVLIWDASIDAWDLLLQLRAVPKKS